MHRTDVASYYQAKEQEEEGKCMEVSSLISLACVYCTECLGMRLGSEGKGGSTVDSVAAKTQSVYRLHERCSFCLGQCYSSCNVIVNF